MALIGKLFILTVCLSVLLWKADAFYRNCKQIKAAAPSSASGVYTIQPYLNTYVLKQVYCDMTTEGGGWTVIQRRGFYPTQENFYRTFIEYAIGFGNLYRDHYAGNQFLYAMSRQNNLQLRVDLVDFNGQRRYAKYAKFYVSNYANRFRLSVAGYSGNAGDSLSYHSGSKFSARDQDNDGSSANCALSYKGGWWYKSCHLSNLNGLYLAGYHASYANGVNWRSWRGYHYSYKFVQMMIR